MNNLVESFIPGRVRLRSSLLKSPAAPLILAAFEDLPGVRSTGSPAACCSDTTPPSSPPSV